jgi:hypothetical protein
MRTALVLLFALALAAIPGSLLPQRNVSPIRASDFIKQHPVLGPVYDKAGLFHVYTSPWFSAVYLLLFISLTGCVIPRVGVYVKAARLSGRLYPDVGSRQGTEISSPTPCCPRSTSTPSPVRLPSRPGFPKTCTPSTSAALPS